MKVLQICSQLNTGSVGRIAEQIGENVLENGGISYIAYAREKNVSKSIPIKIGNKLDLYKHGIYTRLTDRHGFGSKNATKKLIHQIDSLKPDIIHFHNLHGYYINIEVLVNYINSLKIKVIWTLHDCWSFTGHCCFYDYIQCDKWKIACEKCPQIKSYPKSWLVDSSKSNFIRKSKLFNSIENLTLVPVSYWLERELKFSSLKNNNIRVIQNGIDLEQFKPKKSDLRSKLKLEDKFILLGVASPWNIRKGIEFMYELPQLLSDDIQLIMVGLDKKQLKTLPDSIIGIQRTKDVNELAEYYTMADVFINPTLEDTFPTTNLESLACGTPVITYNSGGSPEALDENTGFVVNNGDKNEFINAIYKVKEIGKSNFEQYCITRARQNFNKKINFLKYLELYESVLK